MFWIIFGFRLLTTVGISNWEHWHAARWGRVKIYPGQINLHFRVCNWKAKAPEILSSSGVFLPTPFPWPVHIPFTTPFPFSSTATLSFPLPTCIPFPVSVPFWPLGVSSWTWALSSLPEPVLPPLGAPGSAQLSSSSSSSCILSQFSWAMLRNSPRVYWLLQSGWNIELG